MACQRFDMPGMYALLIAVFGLAILANALMSKVGRVTGQDQDKWSKSP